jgi:hypothetical protein
MALPPKFFIPHTIDPVLAERTYVQIKANAMRIMDGKLRLSQSSRSTTRKMASVYTAKSASLTQKMAKRSLQSSVHLAAPFWCAHQAEVWFQGQRRCLAP